MTRRPPRRWLAIVLVVASPQLAIADGPEFRGLGDLPGGITSSTASDVSADGSVVVGGSYGTDDDAQAFRWTENGGLVGLGFLAPSAPSGGKPWSGAIAVSANGAIVVGTSIGLNGGEPFRWEDGIGMMGLGRLPGSELGGYANAVSADGSVVVGASNSANGGLEAFRWTAATGMVGLGAAANVAYGVSADGQKIVGTNLADDEGFLWTSERGVIPLGFEARDISADGRVVAGKDYRWTEAGGMQFIGDGYAYAVNGNGTIAVGSRTTPAGQEAIIWDAARGMRSLQTLLAEDFGLGPALDGWTLEAAFGISSDGRTIVGDGKNPDGVTEAWIARDIDIPVIAPRVVGVQVDGLSWSADGYSLPLGGGAQTRSLPFTRINQVAIVFDEPVSFGDSQATLTDSAGNEYTLFGPLVTAGTEPGTFKAAWQLEQFLDVGRYSLRLSDGVLDDDGYALDGEWTDNASTRSGDGEPGGEFVFSFNFLPGDSNQDGVVTILDAIEVRNSQGVAMGDPAYNMLRDIDARGGIGLDDVYAALVRAYDVLPASSAAAVPEPPGVEHAAALFAIVLLVAMIRTRRPSGRRTSRAVR